MSAEIQDLEVIPGGGVTQQTVGGQSEPEHSPITESAEEHLDAVQQGCAVLDDGGEEVSVEADQTAAGSPVRRNPSSRRTRSSIV